MILDQFGLFLYRIEVESHALFSGFFCSTGAVRFNNVAAAFCTQPAARRPGARWLLGARRATGPAERPAGHGRSLLAHPNSRGSSGTGEWTLVAGKPEGVQRWLTADGSAALEELQAGGDGDGPGPTGLAQHHPDLQRKPGYPALIGCMSSGRRAAVVWEGPNTVCSSRAMTGHTDSAEAAPSTIGGASASTSAGTSSTPATPRRGLRRDPATVPEQ